MLGTDQSGQTMGVMPCAIAWLFKLINEQKDKTGARFSVRVSAVEVTGKNETLRDLLTDIAQGSFACDCVSVCVNLCKVYSGIQMSFVCERERVFETLHHTGGIL